MITSLKLENWKSHQLSEFSFGPGTNVLVGIVGSGKSSVLDGMCFALFGTFPALQQRKLKLDEAIRSKPAPAKGAKVTLKFTAGEEEYEVSREIKSGKGTTTAELRKDGKLVEGPNAQAVTAKIEELLGVDYDLFSRAVYAEQNQMDFFLRIPKGQRMSKIDELLRIDRFEAARRNSLTLNGEFRSAVEERERVLEDFEARRKEEEKKLREGIDEVKARFDLERQKYAELDEKKKANEKEVRGAELIYRQHTGLVVRLEQLEVQQHSLEAKIKGVKLPAGLDAGKELNAAQKALDAAQAEANKLAAAVEVNSQSLERYQTDAHNLAELEKKLKSLDAEKLKVELEKRRTEYEATKAHAQELKTRAELLERSIGLLETAEECPVCKTKLDGAKRGKIKRDEEKELEEINAELEGIDTAALKDEVEDAEILLRRAEQLEGMIKNLGEPAKEVARLEQLVKKLEAGLSEKEKTVTACRQKLVAAEEAVRALEIREELEKTKSDAERCRKDVAGLNFDEKVYRERKREFEGLLDEWSRARARSESAAGVLEERQRTQKEFAVRLEKAKVLSDELKKMKAGQEFLVRFQNALRVTQGELRQRFVGSLNECMSGLWACYPYGDYTDVRLAIEEGDYVLQLRERGGNWVGVEGTVSGGERSIATLVLRIAFALVLAPQLSMLVLDEPTHNLDAKSVEELAATLRDRISDYISQIFVITHDEALEGAVSGTLYRLERNKAEDGPTEVVLGEIEV